MGGGVRIKKMKNKINRILDNIEKAIGVFGVSLLGMISYLFVNIDKLTNNKLQLWIIGATIDIAIMLILAFAYEKHFDKLKD